MEFFRAGKVNRVKKHTDMQAFSWNGPEAARSVWRVNEMNWKCSYILVRWFYFVDILTMEPFRWNEQLISHETYYELSEKSYFLGIRKPHERYLLIPEAILPQKR